MTQPFAVRAYRNVRNAGIAGLDARNQPRTRLTARHRRDSTTIGEPSELSAPVSEPRDRSPRRTAMTAADPATQISRSAMLTRVLRMIWMLTIPAKR